MNLKIKLGIVRKIKKFAGRKPGEIIVHLIEETLSIIDTAKAMADFLLIILPIFCISFLPFTMCHAPLPPQQHMTPQSFSVHGDYDI